MSEVVPTITVESENGPVVINLSEFNPDVHKVATGEEPEAVAFDRAEAVAYLTEKDVKFAPNIGDKKLKALLEETKAAEAAGE